MSEVACRFRRTSAGARLLRILGFLALAFAGFALVQLGARAQSVANEWTWMSGIKEIPCPGAGAAYCAAPGVYGTRGQAAAANTPGGRVGAVTWTDHNGNLWLFGGATGTNQGPASCACLNDLWKYDPTHKLWTWVRGSNTQGAPGVYGKLGVASSSNVPGARYDAMGWTDTAGNLWLLGGYGTTYGSAWYQNDLWMFNVTTAEWTWVGGSDTYSGGAVYGTQGVPSSANDPGGRRGSSTWVDKNGRFWLFGGYLPDESLINDLWMFDPILHEWTWMGGNPGAGAPGFYGTLGVPSAGNIPGARSGPASWTDASGNFWLFGGNDGTFALGDAAQLNDLWMFNPTTNEWTWVAGSSDPNNPYASYGPQGVESPLSYPWPRPRPITWTDHSGNLWLFGGSDSIGAPFGLYSELWRFNPTTREWAWVNGIDTWDYTCDTCTSGIYGTEHEASSLNFPGGRWFGSSWVDKNGDLWLFGGFGIDDGTDIVNSGGELNDLWFYQTPTLPLTATPLITPAAGASSPVTVTMSDVTPGASIFYTVNGTPPTTASRKYTGPVSLASSTTIHAIAVASGRTNSSVATVVLASYRSSASTPTFTPPAGTYAGKQEVTVSDTTGAATIYYTTNGSAPTTSSAVYNGPITVSPTATVKAIAVVSGYSISAVGSATYTLAPAAAAPKFSPTAGTYTSPQQVTISDATSGAKIYYTTDGTTPTASSTLYSAPISVPSSEVIEAIAIASAHAQSAVAKATYTIEPSASDLKEWAWIPASGNVPEARKYGVSWTDAKGNLWFFGGEGYGSKNIWDMLNELWKYTPSSGEWTLEGGDNVGEEPGVYGVLGVPSAESIPGARESAATWTDLNGNLWLFGGFGLDSYPNGDTAGLNDLWKYTPSTGIWTWMSGTNIYNQAGIYGKLGVPAAANAPGGRNGAVSWTDLSGHLWLFGGDGFDGSGVLGVLNDLWMYSPSSGEWTWMAGSNAAAQHGVYGTRGVPAADNTPGGREGAIGWADPSGNLWLFGGYDYSGAKPYWNDLWRYTPSTGNWTWMGGSETSEQPGICGALGVAAAGNVPGARFDGVGWTDFNGNLWLFGGGGVDSSGHVGALNDLWKYAPGNAEWTWMGGSNTLGQASVDKVPGEFAPGNIPGARWGAVSWTDSNGNFWLYGGGLQYDLWEYVTPPAALKQEIRFVPPPSPVVYGAKSILLSASGGLSGNPVVFSAVSGPCKTSGTYGATLTLTGAGNCEVVAKQAGNSSYAAAISVERTVVVNKALLTITADNQSISYGAAIPALTYTVTGFVNGDTAATALTGQPTLATTAKSSSAPGKYPITVTVGTLKAANYKFAFKNGTLTLKPLGTVAMPAFKPVQGTYTGAQSVTISCATSGATIRFTVDGTTPSLTHGIKYTAAFTVSKSETVKAIAVLAGYNDSAVATAVYTIQ